MKSVINVHLSFYTVISNISDFDSKCFEKVHHINQLSKDFEKEIISTVDRVIQEKGDNRHIEMDAGVQECMYHVALCQEKSQGIKGRDDIIDVSLFLFYLMVWV